MLSLLYLHGSVAAFNLAPGAKFVEVVAKTTDDLVRPGAHLERGHLVERYEAVAA